MEEVEEAGVEEVEEILVDRKDGKDGEKENGLVVTVEQGRNEGKNMERRARGE